MSMAVAANDASKVMARAQMTGYTQSLRPDQQIREVDKQREMEAARDADPDSGVGDEPGHVGSSTGATRMQQNRRSGFEPLGRGQVDWGERNEGIDLPPSLRPQARIAGSTPFNVPYWLLPRERIEDSAAARFHRLRDGMRRMVHNELSQYVKREDSLYTKKTLREVHDMLADKRPSGFVPPPSLNCAGEVSGLTVANLGRARAIQQSIELPAPQPGMMLDRVA